MISSRFAPSNTGLPTVANLRSLLFTYAHVKKNQGKIHLRFEDTDIQRSKLEYAVNMIENLEWLGIKFDKQPDINDVINGNLDKEFFQSKRKDVYERLIEKLIKSGHAYKQPDGSVMFKMPKEYLSYYDGIMGLIESPAAQQKDFVIARADGSVLFHLAVVEHDINFGVNCVVRGSDHALNSIKHIEIYKALGLEPPQYYHLPMVLDKQGQKISKRRDDQFASIQEIRETGILPQAIINALGLLGHSFPDGKDRFDLDYLCQNFDIARVINCNAKYDPDKMKKFNQEIISGMGLLKLSAIVLEYALKFNNSWAERVLSSEYQLMDIVRFLQPRAKTLKDFITQSEFLFETPEITKENSDKIFIDSNIFNLGAFCEILKGMDDWTADSINSALNNYANTSQIKVGSLAQSLRLAVTHSTTSPPIHDTLAMLGKEKTIKRIEEVLNTYMVKI